MFTHVKRKMIHMHARQHVTVNSYPIYCRIRNVHIDVCPYGHFPGRVFDGYVVLHVYSLNVS